MNSLDLKIENALSAGTISIWYQPIYNRETNTFDAAEALMRLYDGEKMLPTFAAICRMEETGEIVRAGELVFEKVCCFHIAKSIHCEPVVEGIEDASQINREFLLGVRYFQGNAFAKAMPEQEYVQFLLNYRRAETRREPKS